MPVGKTFLAITILLPCNSPNITIFNAVSRRSFVLIKTIDKIFLAKSPFTFWSSLLRCSIHQPLYPPGRIIHIVRHHPKGRGGGRSTEPAYQGVWADNKDFDEVLISKRMLQDHMPDNVLDALEKVSNNCLSHILFETNLESRFVYVCWLLCVRERCKFIKLFVKFKHSPLVPENNFTKTLKHALKGIFL